LVNKAVARTIRAAVRARRGYFLLDEPDAGLEVGDGIASLTLRPFDIVTLRPRPTDQGDAAAR